MSRVREKLLMSVSILDFVSRPSCLGPGSGLRRPCSFGRSPQGREQTFTTLNWSVLFFAVMLKHVKSGRVGVSAIPSGSLHLLY